MKQAENTSPIICKTNQAVTWLSIVISCACLSGCQQVLDRLEENLLGSKPNLVTTSAPDGKSLPALPTQISDTALKDNPIEGVKELTANKSMASTPKTAIAKPQLQRPFSEHVPTGTLPKKSTTTASSKRSGTNSAQFIDEDGNPFVESTNTKKLKQPHIYIED